MIKEDGIKRFSEDTFGVDEQGADFKIKAKQFVQNVRINKLNLKEEIGTFVKPYVEQIAESFDKLMVPEIIEAYSKKTEDFLTGLLNSYPRFKERTIGFIYDPKLEQFDSTAEEELVDALIKFNQPYV